jgi:hypothetical protein
VSSIQSALFLGLRVSCVPEIRGALGGGYWARITTSHGFSVGTRNCST